MLLYSEICQNIFYVTKNDMKLNRDEIRNLSDRRRRNILKMH